MSGLVDRWTEEKAKMKEKGRTLFSKGSGSGPSSSSSSSVEEVVKGKEWSSMGLSSDSSKILGNSALLLSSEASVFMVVLCTP
ncbi:hypothetical protein TIFTF001_006878 [Ficus carica]|uniref:Uncharacterized protein n=1 Tax=Ficus carica TaxID=3494 RepID=A0AA87ZJW6_FICCA|nr:hypothetical protein TIFTF001_006878 [Ficus carica]